MPDPTELTLLLESARRGDCSANERLLGLVYEELHRAARREFGRLRSPQVTLQPTVLVNEAWLEIAAKVENLESRDHFFRVAVRAMRDVMADHARRRASEKRGGGFDRVTLSEVTPATVQQGFDLVALHESLEKLASLNDRHARVVELRMLAGMSIEETARILGVSDSTVEKDWRVARAWLRQDLER
ncbi:MAG: sigma-70 family RNA polymerase sigma factor [Planctomycetes bacterium]|nr:sigma-70 family RNA polymerase sigma factor [Planctomycetota bacterium]